jgi:hypothetical protein
VRTGVESRAELTFTDQTLARLGANTIFSFNDGTRNLDLGGGAMLLRVPKGAGGAQINTAAVTAAITGTTVMLEYHPNAYIKFIILEGTGRIFRKGHLGESVLLHAGQMLIVNPNGKGLPDPVDVDLDRLTKTSLLIVGFPPLPSLNLIAREVGSQDEKKNEGGLIQTNLVIFGGGTTVSLLDPTAATIADQANSNEARQALESPTSTPTATATATPTPTETMTPTPTATATVTPVPTPSKEGTPSVISSPVPYVITSGTTIQTDPAITTNGKTDYGKIYRGPTLDGPPSAFLFTATSPFDIALGFDQHFEDINLLPLAVFKFSALQITGNPTISIPEGGATNLALVSVGDITSGVPGGSLTFTGLDSLLLATQDGSITLTSDLSFENIPALAIYARGLGSTLTLDAAITGTTDLFLGAEGNIVANDALTITQTNNGLSLGLFAIVIAGGDITVGNGLSIVNDNSGTGNLLVGGSITLTAGGDLTVNGEGNLTLTVMNDSGGHIGVGGDIFVSTGGDLTAGSVDAFVNARDGGSIDSGGNLIFEVGGALSTTGFVQLVSSDRFDTTTGGTFGSSIAVSLNAASVSAGDYLSVAVSDRSGGHIAGDALVNVAVTGDIFSQTNAIFEIDNDDAFAVGVGGTIDGSATVNVSAANISSSGSFFEALILNQDGGTIGGNASIILNAADISSSADNIFVELSNHTGGQIDGDALISVNAASLSGVANPSAPFGATFFMDTSGGTIGGNANLLVNLTGTMNFSGASVTSFFDVQNSVDSSNDSGAGGTIGGDAAVLVAAGGITSEGNIEFAVLNNDSRFLSAGGTIGGSGTVSLTATSLTAGGFFQPLVNDNFGSIGGSAIVGVAVAGDVSVGTETFFNILNSSGSIGGDAISTLIAGNFSSGSTFEFEILNDNGSVGADALLTANLAGALTSIGDAFIQITNGGGSIGTDAAIVFNAASFTANSLFLQIGNLGGTIGGDSNVTFNVGDLAISGDTAITIDDSADGEVLNGSEISSNATINITAADISAAMFVQILAQRGGAIGGDATINLDAASIVSTATDGLLGITLSSYDAGSIGGNALIALNVSGEISAPSEVEFSILNNDIFGGGGGTIGSDATIDVTANDISTSGVLFAQIRNEGGGQIGGSAALTVDVGGAIDSAGESSFEILNNSVGSDIGGDAAISLTAVNTSADSFLAQIDNSNGGTIGGNATIDMNVSGSATVTGDATVQILGSDGAAAAAINMNGGSYDAGGTFLSLIDGDGAITFTNASIHADVLKVGALGTNGVLNIGGGILSGDTTLELYAPGSNGSIDFVSNVTLNSENSVLIAANTVTINNSVVVTITGDDGINASVFTNVPNYTGSGGNGSTSGAFAGNGAQTQPLDQAPPFGPSGATPTGSTTSAGTTAPIPTTNPGLPGDRGSGADAIIPRGKRHVAIARVTNSNELLDLVDKLTSASAEDAPGTPRPSIGKRSRHPRTGLSGHSLPRSLRAVSPDSIRSRAESGRAIATR